MSIRSLYNEIHDQFPMLKETMSGKPLTYLDSAATALKPISVLQSIEDYYVKGTTNIHRSIHSLGERVTTQYEKTRDTLVDFINASSREEIIFTKGTTDSLNLLARTLGEQLKPGDEIIISELEHHSNIVPWQLTCERTGAVLRIAPIDENGDIDLEAYKKLLGHKTKIVSIIALSNVLGTRNPTKELARLAHEFDALFISDAAQLVVQEKIDVQDLNVDFLTFSAHKLYGPTGVGVLYGKKVLLEKLPPYAGGGDMINQVTFEKTTYNDLPYKFEAGTPNISGVIAFQKSLEFVNDLGFDAIKTYDKSLTEFALEKLQTLPGFKRLGNPKESGSLVSFIIEGIHTHDLATLVSMEGVAMRTGHHCAQPLHRRLGITSSARASFTVYNNEEDIERLYAALKKAQKLMA